MSPTQPASLAPRSAASGTAPIARRRLLRGATAWGAVPVCLITELIGMAAVWVTDSAPYNPLHNVISDLGARSCTTVPYPYGDVPVCSPLSLVVNLGFILCGALMILGSLLLAPLLGTKRVQRGQAWLWGIVGVAAIGAAIPLDVSLLAHSAISLPMVLQGPAIWVTSNGLVRRMPRTAACGKGIAVVAVCASLAMLLVSMSGTYIGFIQRLSVWPGYAWLGWVGWSLLVQEMPRPSAAR